MGHSEKCLVFIIIPTITPASFPNVDCQLQSFDPFTPKFKKYHLPAFLKKDVFPSIDSTIIFHLSKLWRAKFSILCDVIFLVRLQGKFEIDHSWEWKGWKVSELTPSKEENSVFSVTSTGRSAAGETASNNRCRAWQPNSDSTNTYNKGKGFKTHLDAHRGNSPFCRVVISILSQRLQHKITNSRALFIADVKRQNLAKKLSTYCSPDTCRSIVKCICCNMSCALGKWILHSRWDISPLSLSYASMSTNADQWQWRQIRITTVSSGRRTCYESIHRNRPFLR